MNSLSSDPLVYKTTSSLCCCDVMNLSQLAIIYDLSRIANIGIVPLCFKSGEDAETLGLTGHERYTIHLPSDVNEIKPGQDITVTTDTAKSFVCTLRLDTEVELAYYNHGGMLSYIIRSLSNE